MYSVDNRSTIDRMKILYEDLEISFRFEHESYICLIFKIFKNCIVKRNVKLFPTISKPVDHFFYIVLF